MLENLSRKSLSWNRCSKPGSNYYRYLEVQSSSQLWNRMNPNSQKSNSLASHEQFCKIQSGLILTQPSGGGDHETKRWACCTRLSIEDLIMLAVDLIWDRMYQRDQTVSSKVLKNIQISPWLSHSFDTIPY